MSEVRINLSFLTGPIISGATKNLNDYFRWTCQAEKSVSGPAVLTISIPTGFALSESQKKRLTEEDGHDVWATDSEIVFFFEKVLKNSKSFGIMEVLLIH